MKCVLILDESLPAGIGANTAAALGLSLGSHVPGLIGPDLSDASGILHRGVTSIPLPILVTDRERLNTLYRSLLAQPQDAMTLIGFDAVAQRCLCYDEYVRRLAQTPPEEIDYLGVCLLGPKKRINSLCGQFRLLR